MASNDDRPLLIRNTAARIARAKGKRDEAQGTIGSIYEAAEREHDMHRGALKLAIKWKGMEPTALSAMKAALDEYCDALGVFDQGELDTSEGEGAAPPQPPAEPRAAEPAVAAPRTNGAAARPAERFEDGSQRELGRRARLAGKPRDDNPNEAGSVDAQQFDIGWGEAEQEHVDRAAQAESANKAPRRKRASPNGGEEPAGDAVQ